MKLKKNKVMGHCLHSSEQIHDKSPQAKKINCIKKNIYNN